MRTAERARRGGRAAAPVAIVLLGAGTGVGVAWSLPHHPAHAPAQAARFRTIATAPHVGATTDATGKPSWLPDGAALLRHDIDEYGVHVWVYTVGRSPTADSNDAPTLRITAVPAAMLQAPAPPDTSYQATPQLVDGNPGQLLQRVAGGLQRVDFLRAGVAYTVILTGAATTAADPTTVLHVAQRLQA